MKKSRKKCRYDIDMVTQSDDYMVLGLINLRERIQESDRSKYVMYKMVNPSLSVHNVYKRGGNEYVREYLRVSFTRVRLSSHRLMIETGRWSRIPRENRLCACGVIQDEAHVIQVCPNVGHIRLWVIGVNASATARVISRR